MQKNSHSECDHPRTKAARAACRRARAAQKTQISPFLIEEAHMMNEMWENLNSRQVRLLNVYCVVDAVCDYCEQEAACFKLENLGLNVCGPCERMFDVHEHEEKYN